MCYVIVDTDRLKCIMTNSGNVFTTINMSNYENNYINVKCTKLYYSNTDVIKT